MSDDHDYWVCYGCETRIADTEPLHFDRHGTPYCDTCGAGLPTSDHREPA